ncbi:MAG: hypothetical protein ACREP1_00675, partial [Rhodanobacteraceae bacterium]
RRCGATDAAVVSRFAAFRFAVSLIAVSAWLAAANHCAIGAMAASDQAAAASMHAECPGHHSPHHDGGGGEMECCKSFPPAAVDAGKNLVSYDFHSFVLQLYFVSAVLPREESRLDLRPLELDTGPPFAGSFVESVLQRSILAHAPPTLA